MTELIRKVEENDLTEISNLLLKVFNDSNYITIQRLGGMMNRSYKVTRENEEEYLVRIPGEGTDELINREDEVVSTKLACKLKIDSELIYMDNLGYKVMKFIHNPVKMSNEIMKRNDVIKQAAAIFNRLHNSNVDTLVNFDIFEKAQLYENIILNNSILLYDNYYEIKSIVLSIYNDISKKDFFKVPCHNDCLVDNWVLDENNHLYLIDWEFAGMNDPFWDLSCLSIESDYSFDDDNILLEYYFNRKVTSEERKHFVAFKIFIDYLWTLWGLTRVPFDGEFMQEYADNRYNRLLDNIEKYEKIK